MQKYTVVDLEEEIPDNMQWELHDGELYLIGSPKSDHQDIVGELFGQLREYFKGKRCHPYIAPFDLYLFNDPNDAPADLYTKFQPDIFVACEQSRIVRGTHSGYYGVPALIIEVLSKST